MKKIRTDMMYAYEYYWLHNSVTQQHVKVSYISFIYVDPSLYLLFVSVSNSEVANSANILHNLLYNIQRFFNRGRKPGFARKESVEKKIMGKEKLRRSKKELQNFYRFQIRESKMKRKYEKNWPWSVCFHSSSKQWSGMKWSLYIHIIL
jgi:hypothetical protein